MEGDYIIQIPEGYEIGIRWSRNETIKFRMQHMAQALFVREQANNPQSRLMQLMEWFDDASLEDIEKSKSAVEFVISEHDKEQDPNAAIPSPVPAIINQVRDHFWNRAFDREIARLERAIERSMDND